MRQKQAEGMFVRSLEAREIFGDLGNTLRIENGGKDPADVAFSFCEEGSCWCRWW